MSLVTNGAQALQSGLGLTAELSPLGKTDDLLNTVNTLSSTVDKLTNTLTALLGNVLNGSLGGNDLFGSNNSAQGNSNTLDGNNLLSNLFLQALSDALDNSGQSLDSLRGNSGTGNGPSKGMYAASPGIAAYMQGVSDALSSIQNQGLSNAGNRAAAGDSFNQLGAAVGLGVGQKAALQTLGDISTHHDGQNRHFVDKEDRSLAKEIGQFMDQYENVFGKPEYQKDGSNSAKQDDKSWAKALSNPDDDGMTKASLDQFMKAVGMIKSAVAGDTGNANLQARGTGGSPIGIDAAMVGDKVTNMALDKLAA